MNVHQLKEGTAVPGLAITNCIVAELYQYRYRRRKDIKWKIVLEGWWPKLFPEQYTPPLGTVINSWENVVKDISLEEEAEHMNDTDSGYDSTESDVELPPY